MKKIKFTIAIIIVLLCSNTINAQLKMSTTGNIMVATSPVPASNIKLYTLQTAAPNNTWNQSINGTVSNMRAAGSWCAGIAGSAAFPTPLGNLSYGFGVYGGASNALWGQNYGVYGCVGGSNAGVGVFGSSRLRTPVQVPEDYAGYFNGNVKIGMSTADYLQVYTIINLSDQRLKKNITPLTNTINLLSGLNAFEYKYKTRQELISDGIASADTAGTNLIENASISKTHYGYLAQDVQQVLPELVYIGADSLLAIDYIGFIPLVIQAVKEQNITIQNQTVEIKGLKEQINKCCSFGTNDFKTINETNSNNDLNSAILYQNTPNPFTRETSIKCFIPNNAIVSDIYIYNMQGTQLKKIAINDKGEKTIIIQGSEFTAGMYMYTLIIDGKEIGTKKMILTD
ncbi:MAG: tail fiber domain-containing protein [Bacteroidetes bacterium]|nr:tail fiber domain-containing protein [Bacteroidota bacterium]